MDGELLSRNSTIERLRRENEDLLKSKENLKSHIEIYDNELTKKSEDIKDKLNQLENVKKSYEIAMNFDEDESIGRKKSYSLRKSVARQQVSITSVKL